MRIVYIIASLILAVNALTEKEQWDQFKINFGKTYSTASEEKNRFEIFQNNLKIIKEHNAKYKTGQSTHTLGVNQFADVSKDELKNAMKSYIKPTRRTQQVYLGNINDIPDAFDWRDQHIGAESQPRDQGWCLKSSWAFSAIGALEGQNAILNKKNQSFLSVQQLIDCSDDFGNIGCNGGSQISAFQYVQFNGMSTEKSYPYTENNGTCKATTGDSALEVTGYRTVTSTEDALKAAVASIGPISANIYITPALLYTGGVFSESDCVNDLDFLDMSVLVVGYGTEPASDTAPATDFWSIKLSWGVSWGEGGYLRLARGIRQCGIALDTSYPVVKASSE